MIIQINTEQELDRIKTHVSNVPECELPCLLNATMGLPLTVSPLDTGVMDKVSASVAVESLKEDKLYEMLRELPAYKIERLIKRLQEAE